MCFAQLVSTWGREGVGSGVGVNLRACVSYRRVRVRARRSVHSGRRSEINCAGHSLSIPPPPGRSPAPRNPP
ncbi:unnamed protein product [Danaus chrysippus]|uniref:(African queen) hypothetical protein n=1 Tax=Danaus chrysippus TaxID=151541 RepID=A0A8J2QEE5_9NEOP|nr:unnamed protein product [Danaus chrysippus]